MDHNIAVCNYQTNCVFFSFSFFYWSSQQSYNLIEMLHKNVPPPTPTSFFAVSCERVLNYSRAKRSIVLLWSL